MELRTSMIRVLPKIATAASRSFGPAANYGSRPTAAQLRSLFYQTRMASSTPPKPTISEGSNAENITFALQHELLPPNSHWQLTPSGLGIQRTFKFKTFKKAWSFMDRVAQECKTARHHPEWANTYNTVFVRWTTHSPRGLSDKDVAMAMFCDEYAEELGAVPVDEVEVKDGGKGVEGLADEVVERGGDCCVPKKK